MTTDAETTEAGTGRVRLTFRPDGGEVRVPAGTTVFDGASWNGIAIDSTCGGHGTCKKCRVRITAGEVPIDTLDPRAFSPDELRDGWRLACRADRPARPRGGRAAAADAAEGGAGRGRPPRDPAAGRAEALPGAGRAVAGGPAVRPGAGAGRGRRLRAAGRAGRGAQPRSHAARIQLQGHRRHLRRPADRRRAGRHQRPPPRDRVRPRHHHRGGDPARPGHRPAAGGALDAESPAAVRRRCDLAGVGHDDGPGRAGGAAAARPRDHERAGGGGAARRPGWHRPTSTRSSSAATSP